MGGGADPLLCGVARGALGTTPLSSVQMMALAEALGPELAVTWYPSRAERWRIAQLGMLATGIRLRTPETFAVHRRVVDFRRPRSPAG